MLVLSALLMSRSPGTDGPPPDLPPWGPSGVLVGASGAPAEGAGGGFGGFGGVVVGLMGLVRLVSRWYCKHQRWSEMEQCWRRGLLLSYARVRCVLS